MALSQFHVPHEQFVVDAVLFDMDGTLTDSIKAVEHAWGSVANKLQRDPDEVIAATHGRRAIDNLRDLKPHLRRLSNKQMEPHVDEFERSILKAADEYGEKVDEARSRRGSSVGASRPGSLPGSRPSSRPGSRKGSMVASRKENILKPNQFGLSQLSMTATTTSPLTTPSTGSDSLHSVSQTSTPPTEYGDVFDEDDDLIEVDCENRSVIILPGVKRMIDSIPEGRYAVATSGAKVYCHGCLTRVDIKPPAVTITADHDQLERGKPHPDPFLLAAKHLGYDPKKCLVVEDSPSGIKAGVASGATVIAVCTSHPREKIAHCGAHYIVPSLDHVRVHVESDGTLRIVLDEISAFPHDHYSAPANAEMLARKLDATVLAAQQPVPQTIPEEKEHKKDVKASLTATV